MSQSLNKSKHAESIKNTGTEIRCQGPLIKGVNDNPEVWSQLWAKEIAMGMIPYYMFIEANHHPTKCFRIPFAETLRILQEAQKQNPKSRSS